MAVPVLGFWFGSIEDFFGIYIQQITKGEGVMMNGKYIRSLFFSVSLLAPMAALAQEVPATSESDAGDDIVVTAQKRTELLRDVPLAVTALTSDTLLERNQSRLQDYFATVPGLAINSQGNGFSTLSIRGVSTGLGNNPSVGVVIDEVPFGSSTLIGLGARILPDLDPSSLSRVEILRGPQGTLYGASSIGGLLKFVTREPSTDALGGRFEAGVSTVDEGEVGFTVRGQVNIPISETLAIRGGGFFRRDPGYVDNARTGEHDVNRLDSTGGNVALLWKPSADVSVKLAALLQDVKGDGTSEVETNYLFTPTIGDFQQSRLADTGFFRNKSELYSANINVDLGGVTATSITGYGVSSFSNARDISATFGFFSSLFYGAANSGSVYYNPVTTKKWSEEFRLASDTDGPLEWLVGGFYTREVTANPARIVGANAATGETVGTLIFGQTRNTFREIAGFADATYHFDDRFSLQLGARYSDYRQSFNEVDSGDFYPAPETVSAQTTGDAFLFLIAPQFKISPDMMLYGRVSSGYRVGGPNPAASLGFPANFGPDQTTNYEIGLKGKAGWLTYDLAAFHIDWRDIQIQQRAAAGFQYYTNAGKAESDGVELSFDARPTSGFRISGSGAYNVAELTSALPAAAGVGNKGDRLPGGAKFSGSLSPEFEFPLGGLDGFFGATLSHVGSRLGNFPPSAASVRLRYPAYTTLDLRAGLNAQGWTATIYAANIGNKRGILGGEPLRLSGANTIASDYTANYIRPRTFGFSIAKEF